MIKLDVIDDQRQHFLVRGDEPFRVEVSLTPTDRVIAHIYRGYEVKREDSPLGMFDGTNRRNVSWTDEGGEE